MQRIPVIVIPALAAILASPATAIAQHQRQILIDRVPLPAWPAKLGPVLCFGRRRSQKQQQWEDNST